MQVKRYQTRTGKMQYRPVVTMGELHEDTLGFCVGCGAEADSVEPDARQHVCEVCERPKVYGLEELLVMGLLELKEDQE